MLSSIRTVTVGSGISPDLLTLRLSTKALAGSELPRYRRWGVAPRPENTNNIGDRCVVLQEASSRRAIENMILLVNAPFLIAE